MALTNVTPTHYVTAKDGTTPLLPSAARTTTQILDKLKNLGGKGIEVIVNVSVNAGGYGSITFSIQAVDQLGNVVTGPILAGAAITTVSVNRYVVHPELTASSNLIAKDVIGHDFQIVITANNANPVTYSVDARIIP